MRGFSLVEMAIVLLIIGLLVGGLMGPLGAQMEASRIKDTQNQINNIQDALYGFAAANGRLPCPATIASGGLEDRVPATGQCNAPYTGFVPGSLLGLTPLNVSGFVVDAWGAPIHYAVAPQLNAANGQFIITFADGIRNLGLPAFGALSGSPFLYVCASATGITATTCGPIPANALTSDAVAVVYSTGPNVGGVATGIDEAANPNPSSANSDAVFVSHVRSDAGAAGGYFDDIVVWIPRSILVSKLLTAGRLP